MASASTVQHISQHPGTCSTPIHLDTEALKLTNTTFPGKHAKCTYQTEKHTSTVY